MLPQALLPGEKKSDSLLEALSHRPTSGSARDPAERGLTGLTAIPAVRLPGNFPGRRAPEMSLPDTAVSMKPSKESTGDNAHYRFSPDEFGPIAPAESGAAHKLSDSAVAPIVAAARGYRTITEAKDFKEFMDEVGVDRTAGQRRLKSTFLEGGQDVLVMPWHSSEDITNDREGPTTYQWRPEKPRPQKGTPDKKVKYETPSGDIVDLPMDVHPSTPKEWLTQAPTVLLAEGMLKGDSALSAYLAEHGASAELLGYTGSDARKRLRAFLEGIDDEDRVLIGRPSSATTFKKDSNFYNSVPTRGRDFWLGVDADVSANGMVWKQIKDIYDHLISNRANSVNLLAPRGLEDIKAGIDDFLSHYGDWNALLEHLAAGLPDKPEESDEDLRNGAWRVAESGTYCEKKVINQSDGGSFWVDWVRTLDFAATVTSFIIRRTPTAEEMSTGILSEESFSKEDEVELLFQWEFEGNIETAKVVMLADVMDLSVESWGSKGASIPHNLRMHPHWPPRGNDGVAFMEAVRRASSHQEKHVYWKRNGWVPVNGSTPAFIVGKDVVCADEDAAVATHSDVDANDVNSYASYGIGGDPEVLIRDPGAPLGEWQVVEEDDRNQTLRFTPNTEGQARAKREQILHDTERVKELLFDSGAWTNPAHAALMFATALRPCVPTPGAWPRAPLYIYGGKSQGKSMTAEYLMSFWSSSTASYRGFTSGQATATAADLEASIGTMPIWLADDLPPSVSKTKAMKEEDVINYVVRSSFNQQARTRRRPDMTAKKSMDPYAQLVITAENQLSVPSAWDRVNSIYLAPGSLHPDTQVTEQIAEAAREDGLFARVTFHFVEWMVKRIAAHGWRSITDAVSKARDFEEKKAAKELADRGLKPSSIKRSSILVAEMNMVLNLFERFLNESGTSWETLRSPNSSFDEASLELTVEADIHSREPGTLKQAIYKHTVETRIETEAQRPGRLMVEALSQALNSGLAHVLSAEDPHRPPITVDDESDEHRSMSDNVALGWKPRSNELEPSGQQIGWLIKRDGEEVILFFVDESFRLVYDRLSDLVRPGSHKISTWRSVYGEGFIDRRIAAKDNKSPGYRRQVKLPGAEQPTKGVPIRLSVLQDPEVTGEPESIKEG